MQRRRSLHRLAASAAAGEPSAGSLIKSVTRRSEHPEELPSDGDLVRIHYVGTLEDGTVFDSSRARGKPFDFNLGEDEVIDGWDMLIRTMALGERANLFIPPEYAYGEAGCEPIVPPNARLTFDVELLDIGRPIKDEEDDDSEDEDEEDVARGGESMGGETLLDDDGLLFWEKDPERESGRGSGYAWQATGTGKEICVTVPLSPETKVKEIKVDIRTFSLSCKIAGKTVIDGKVWAEVDMDESHWDLENKGGKGFLLIYLAKLKESQKWESLLEGGEAQEVLEAEVVDVDAALRVANAARRRADAN